MGRASRASRLFAGYIPSGTSTAESRPSTAPGTAASSAGARLPPGSGLAACTPIRRGDSRPIGRDWVLLHLSDLASPEGVLTRRGRSERPDSLDPCARIYRHRWFSAGFSGRLRGRTALPAAAGRNPSSGLALAFGEALQNAIGALAPHRAARRADRPRTSSRTTQEHEGTCKITTLQSSGPRGARPC